MSNLINVVEVASFGRPVTVAELSAIVDKFGQIHDHHCSLLPNHLNSKKTSKVNLMFLLSNLSKIKENINTLQPHYNTIIYSTNSVITQYRLGSHYLYFIITLLRYNTDNAIAPKTSIMIPILK